MSTTFKDRFSLRPATPADAIPMARCEAAAFKPEAFTLIAFGPEFDSEAAIERRAGMLREEIEALRHGEQTQPEGESEAAPLEKQSVGNPAAAVKKEDKHIEVITENSTGAVVAFATWNVLDVDIDPQHPDQQEQKPTDNVENKSTPRAMHTFVSATETAQRLVKAGRWEIREIKLPADPNEDFSDLPPEERQTKARDALFVTLADKKNEQLKMMGFERVATLTWLVVEPTYQHLGIGSYVMKRGLDRIDAQKLPTWLGSSEFGHKLYTAYGFRDLSALTMDLSKYGGKKGEWKKHWGMWRSANNS